MEADGVDRGMGTGENQMADVSAAFPAAMPGALAVPAVATAEEPAANQTTANNAFSFGDDWGVFGSGGTSGATASTPAYDAFASKPSSQLPQASSATPGGDLLSQTLGEFGLQTSDLAPSGSSAAPTSTQFNFPGASSDNDLLGGAIVREQEYPPNVKAFLESLP